MFRYGPLHALGEIDPADGRRYAVTIYPQHICGALVLAGKLHRHASDDKPVESLTNRDYYACQRVSFSDWHDIWSFFTTPPYDALLAEIRDRAERFGANTHR